MNKTSFKTGIAGAVAAALLRAAVARKIAAGAGIAVLAMGAAACANPLESELDDLKSENEKLKEQNEELSTQLAALSGEKTEAERNLAEAQAELDAANTQLANAITPEELAAANAAKDAAEQNLATAQTQLAQKNTLINVADWLYEEEADGTTNKRKGYIYPRTPGDSPAGNIGISDQNKFMNSALDYWKANPNATEQEIKNEVNSTLFHPVNDEIAKLSTPSKGNAGAPFTEFA